MKLEEFFERFIFVRKCAGCGELIDYDLREDAFCSLCRINFERVKAEPCKICSRAMVECDCMPKRLSRAGLPVLKKLFSYKAAKTSLPESRFLYFLKHNRNKRVVSFTAAQLNMRLCDILRDNELAASEVVLTYIPRGKKAIANEGFDQSELICRELSRISKVELIPLLRRTKKGAEQKRLDDNERAKNAKSIECIDENILLVGNRSVILFDDVVTSGASMAESLRALRRHGVKNVFGLCIAMTESTKNMSCKT